jgi:Replication-relaxation
MAPRVTERDVRMLARLALCRWLTTAQIQRSYFPKASLNAVQKRLRKLSESGYVRSYREHPTAEAIHAVGPKGKPLVEEKGIEVALGGEVPKQLEHLLGVNDIRIAVETSAIPVAWFFAYWQLADLGWRHPIIPDAVFAMRAPERRVFLAEYDRGTETLDKIFGKLRKYADGFEGFPFEAVLLLTEEVRRFDLLSREMRREGLALPVLASTLAAIHETGLFEAEFLELAESTQRRILDGNELAGGGT